MQHTPPLNGNLADPDRPWINADPGAGVAGSRVDADFFNRVQAEILAVITGAGLVPTNADLTQLYQAISSMVTGGAGGKVAKAGDSMTGALLIALAALQLTLRHSDNTATLKDHQRFFRGSGVGTRAALVSLGDAANGLSEIDLQFLSAADALVKAFKFKNTGRLELGADPTLALEAATKQYVDAAVSIPAATTSVSGIVQLLIASEIDTGTNTTKAATAAALAGSKRIANAWANFDGASGTIRRAFNISSITRTGVGKYTANFTNNMPNANYCPVFGVMSSSASVMNMGAAIAGIPGSGPSLMSTSQLGIQAGNASGNVDIDIVTFSIFAN